MFHSLGMKPKRKHFFDNERLAAVLKQKGSPLPNASRSAPDGYWFLVAQALSGFKHSSSKYTNADTMGCQTLISSVPLPLRGTEKILVNLQHSFTRLWPTTHFQATMYQQCFQLNPVMFLVM